MWNNSRPGGVIRPRHSSMSGRATPKACWPRPWPPSKRRPRADPPRHRTTHMDHGTLRSTPTCHVDHDLRPRRNRRGATPPSACGRSSAGCTAPSATSLDARYYLYWGGGGLGVLAIVRFPMDARHPVAQKPYGAYAVGDVFPFMYQGQLYHGHVIERL